MSPRAQRFSPDDEVVPGVAFGRREWVASPAFWVDMIELEGEEAEDFVSPSGTPLAYDLAFCLLGGYGVKMELNRAAWQHLHDAGAFSADPVPSALQIEDLLSVPLSVDGRLQKYRYLSIRFQQRPPFRVQSRPLLGRRICDRGGGSARRSGWHWGVRSSSAGRA